MGRWTAPFETVRRYLVTGQVEAGRSRALAHDAIVNAMTQISRWGPTARSSAISPNGPAARAAVSALMERYAAVVATGPKHRLRRSPASKRRNPSSSRTGTPSSWALASFEPARSPATR